MVDCGMVDFFGRDRQSNLFCLNVRPSASIDATLFWKAVCDVESFKCNDKAITGMIFVGGDHFFGR